MDREKIRDEVTKAAGLIKAARDKAEALGDNASADDKAVIDTMLAEAVEIKAKADAGLADLERSAKAADLADWATKSAGKLPGMGREAKPDGDGARTVEIKRGREYKTVSVSSPAEAEYTDAFRSYLVKGAHGLSEAETKARQRKALSFTTDTEGGFLVPEAFLAELVQGLEDATFMRQVSRVLPPLMNAGAIAVPAQDTDLADATWTSEIATGSADTVQPFDQRKLTPHPLAKRILVSRTLLRLAAIDVEGWLREEMGARFADPMENAYLNGTGAQQPEGVFVNATVTTNAVTAASATDIAADDLINTEFALKSQYRSGAQWIIHRTILKEIHLLKDGNGQYILRPGLVAGQRASLLGYPVLESEYAPSASTTGLDVAALGNWGRAYWIVDSMSMEIQRLDELYAATNQVGFIGRMETDGMVVDPNGVTKLTMA